VAGEFKIGVMSEFVSPVPNPALDAQAPEPYEGIYGMPMFLSIPTPNLDASREFWLRGLGFIDLFSILGRLTHLRRWAFQDVLLVPGEACPVVAASVSFACVLSQLDELRDRCEELRPGCTTGPQDKVWNSRELTVITPENTRVVMTAAVPIDPNGERADWLRDIGIEVPAQS
jgi:hypothetical protein